MNFQLVKSTASTKALAKFNVMRGDDLVGSITVKPEEEADLLAHWKGAPTAKSSPKNAASNAGKQISAMIKAGRPPSRAAVLRGC